MVERREGGGGAAAGGGGGGGGGGGSGSGCPRSRAAGLGRAGYALQQCGQLQDLIDISLSSLQGLRTKCAASNDLTQQEIRTLEVRRARRPLRPTHPRAHREGRPRGSPSASRLQRSPRSPGRSKAPGFSLAHGRPLEVPRSFAARLSWSCFGSSRRAFFFFCVGLVGGCPIPSSFLPTEVFPRNVEMCSGWCKLSLSSSSKPNRLPKLVY